MNKYIVVYVDDDHEDTEIMQEIFSSIPNAPRLFIINDSSLALKKIMEMCQAGEQIGYVIMDMNMPQLPGKILAESLRGEQSLNQIPMAFMSTSHNPNDEALAQTLGMTYFKKPNSLEDLEILVKGIIAKCGQR